MKLGNYWLKEPPIGWRRIICFYLLVLMAVLFGLFFLKDPLNLLPPTAVAGVITIYLAKNLIQKGYYHRLEEFESLGEKLEVRDFILPSNKHKNVRALKLRKGEGIYSYILLYPQKGGAMGSYDFCRLFAKLFLRKIKRALVLGGGGVSVPIALAKNYPEITIDVVEIDPKIIKVAEKYFVPEEKLRRKINFIHTDASKFVKTRNSKYQFIFNDLFLGRNLPLSSSRPTFVNWLKSLLDKDGVLVVNTGYQQVNLSGKLTKRYAEIFRKVFVFLVEKSIVLLIPGENIKPHLAPRRIKNFSSKTRRQVQGLSNCLLWEMNAPPSSHRVFLKHKPFL